MHPNTFYSEQNFVPETMLYFCPKQQCIIKQDTPLDQFKPPDRIRADSSFTDITIAAFKDNG